MQKELRMWRSEASRWQTRLAAVEQHSQQSHAEESALDSVDVEIAKKQAHIELLKRRMIENEAELTDLLAVITGGT